MKGEKRGLEYVWLMLAVTLLICVAMPTIFAKYSSQGNFNITKNGTHFNWTHDSIFLTANITNTTNITLAVGNSSTMIFSNYSQYNLYDVGDYSVLTNPNFDICFKYDPNTYPNNSMEFKVQDSTGAYTNISGVLNDTNTTTFNLTPYLFCPPGKYYGYFYVYDKDNHSDNLTVNALINIPISVSNTYDPNSTSAFFRGSLTQDNPLHKFYMNTSFENVSSVMLNLTWSTYSEDIDVFLLNQSSSLIGKSIEKSSSESLYHSVIPGQIFKFAVFGNYSETYTGNLYFSTINSSDGSLDFGSVDPNGTSGNLNFTLSNLDDGIVYNVTESIETYRKRSWSSGSPGTFEFLVPDFATKVKALVRWTNTSNRWNISLKDSEGTLLGSSHSKYENANDTGVEMEEFVAYTGSISTDNDGYWMINVTNLTNASFGTFDVEAYVWMGSGWVSTNFTEGFDFNSSGLTNSSLSAGANITAPAQDLLNGSYEGHISYSNGSGWEYRIPVSFYVKAGNLMINHSFERSGYYHVDNTGFNRISDPIQVSIPYNNTGGYPVYHTMSSSGLKLNKSNNYIDFTVGSLPNPIPVGGNGTIDINFTINTSRTNNAEGIYSGWVLFNTSNATLNSSSYPFGNFNLSFLFNLTDLLNVTIKSVSPSLVNNENASNVTIKATVRLINGTAISKDTVFNYSNFRTLRLRETNVTSTYCPSSSCYDLTGKTTGGPGGSGCTPGSPFECSVKGTLASGSVGGRYDAHASVSWNTSLMGGTGEVNLTGSRRENNFVVNDTGLYTDTSPNGTGMIMNEESIEFFYVKLKNYGPVDADSTKVEFYVPSSCYLSVVAQTSGSTCSPSASDENFTVNVNGYDPTGCLLRWRVVSEDVSEDKNCDDAEIRIWDKKAFDDVREIYFTIIANTTSTSSSDEDTPVTGQQATCSSDSDCAYNQYCSSGSCLAVSCSNGYVSDHECIPYERKLEITDYNSTIEILQGSTESTMVSVKNTGNRLVTAKLLIAMNTSNITASVSPTSYSLNTSVSGVFSVNLSADNSTEVGYYVVTAKAYYPDDTSVYDTKDITIAVLPLESTKAVINSTYANYRQIFESYENEFRGIFGMEGSVNYTRANNSYMSLSSMLSDIEEYLSQGNYLEANALLDDVNRTLDNFDQRIRNLLAESQMAAFGRIGDMWTWAAIGIVLVVIIVFVVYLLLPPREGYHPLAGFRPKKQSVFERAIGGLGSHLRRVHHHVKKQMNLSQFSRGGRKKDYMEGYSKVGKFEKPGLASKIKRKLKRK